MRPLLFWRHHMKSTIQMLLESEKALRKAAEDLTTASKLFKNEDMRLVYAHSASIVTRQADAIKDYLRAER